MKLKFLHGIQHMLPQDVQPIYLPKRLQNIHHPNPLKSQQILQQVTGYPTLIPTDLPTKMPTKHPSPDPTQIPTDISTGHPTKHSSTNPTQIPTDTPTKNPSTLPSKTPTKYPSPNPTQIPTDIPTMIPSFKPSEIPTNSPTQIQTTIPNKQPSSNPTQIPTIAPTGQPTLLPTNSPTTVLTTVNSNQSPNPTKRTIETTTEYVSDIPTTKSTAEPTISSTFTDKDAPGSFEWVKKNVMAIVIGVIALLFMIICILVIIVCGLMKLFKTSNVNNKLEMVRTERSRLRTSHVEGFNGATALTGYHLATQAPIDDMDISEFESEQQCIVDGDSDMEVFAA
eukprot:1116417_1